jgi:hypothetical protein
MKVDCKDEGGNMCDITMWTKVGNTDESCKKKDVNEIEKKTMSM